MGLLLVALAMMAAWVIVSQAIAAGATAIDRVKRPQQDYAFWLHLAGVTAFWGGLSATRSAS
jgi:hypothetical protein